MSKKEIIENVREDSQLAVKMELKIEIVCQDGEYVIGTYHLTCVPTEKAGLYRGICHLTVLAALRPGGDYR